MDLIEKIAKLAGCAYISDLNLDVHKEELYKQIQSLLPEEASAAQWNSLAAYLGLKAVATECSDEAYKQLLEQLSS